MTIADCAGSQGKKSARDVMEATAISIITEPESCGKSGSSMGSVPVKCWSLFGVSARSMFGVTSLSPCFCKLCATQWIHNELQFGTFLFMTLWLQLWRWSFDVTNFSFSSTHNFPIKLGQHQAKSIREEWKFQRHDWLKETENSTGG